MKKILLSAAAVAAIAFVSAPAMANSTMDGYTNAVQNAPTPSQVMVIPLGAVGYAGSALTGTQPEKLKHSTSIQGGIDACRQAGGNACAINVFAWTASWANPQ